MKSESEVIVSSDDTGISMGGGISGCILKTGGEAIRQDAQKKLPAQSGDVVVSMVGTLEHQKFIFHCLTKTMIIRVKCMRGGSRTCLPTGEVGTSSEA